METKEEGKSRFLKGINIYKVLLCILLIAYTIVSFIRLGNIKSPKTFMNLKEKESVVYQLEKGSVPVAIVFFYGSPDKSFGENFDISFSNEYDSSHSSFELDANVKVYYNAIYCWDNKNINFQRKDYEYVMITSNNDGTVFGEIAFFDETDKIIKAKLIEGPDGAELLNDEQETIQQRKNHLNSAYFDEIYFPRAAYEIFNNKYIFEFVHPPLGKIIMWIPMAILGISPFSMRLMGNLSGILMIFIMYEIARELFKKEKYALFAAFIIALDGMHFVQSRVATVDVFLVLFSMISILFFIKYLKCKNENERKKYIYFVVSGITWGCAVATKWSACYLGLGLGILFFINYICNEKIVIDKKFNYKPILMGIISFVVLPILIYVASYIPVFCNSNNYAPYYVLDAEGNKISASAYPHTIKEFFTYQYAMYQYHKDVGTAENYRVHPYSSKWYTWPIMYKPMSFNICMLPNGLISGIVSMGNPIIWWLSIVTAIIMLIYSIIKRDKVGIGILILILSTWVPYAFISREMFLYHYFLTSILMMLTIVFVMARLGEKKPKTQFIMILFIVIFLGAFLFFYPIYGGVGVDARYMIISKWLSSWSY
jgi:dolichyl-phosphate-mannose--protein O-mannosyl transferase